MVCVFGVFPVRCTRSNVFNSTGGKPVENPWVDEFFKHRDKCGAVTFVDWEVEVFERHYKRSGRTNYMLVCGTCKRSFKIAEQVAVGCDVRLLNVVEKLRAPSEAVSLATLKLSVAVPRCHASRSIKERRRSVQRRWAMDTSRPVAWRGGVLYFVEPISGDYLGRVLGAPELPFPKKLAHGEGGPRAWRNGQYLTGRARAVAEQNRAYLERDSRPSPAPTIGKHHSTPHKPSSHRWH